MCRSGDSSGKGLVRYRPDIHHGEIPLCKPRVKVVKRDSRLSDNISLLDVDLYITRMSVSNKTKHGTVKFVPQATDLIGRFAT